MVKMFFFMALVFSLLSYLNIDPMKSSLFLIFSLLVSMPIMSFGLHNWFSYFVCLLFLSGIFVILVYFSSFSKINMVKSYMAFVSIFITMAMIFPILLMKSNSLGLNIFYSSVYWFVLIYILFILLVFMNFTSYYLNFSGALRKV